MQDSLSPKKVRNGYDVYAKPVVMSQPEETKVKQRQRLLSGDEAPNIRAQDSRPPTPPGRLQMGKISSMLQSSFTEGRAVPQRHHSSASRHVREGQPTAMHNGHASHDSEDCQGHQALSSSRDEITPAASPDRSTPAVAEAIANFEKRIGQRDEEASVGKQNSMASPTEEGDRPLSNRSSQRAEALRQLRELWFSDEAIQPGVPDPSRGNETPLHALACNGHAHDSCSPQPSTSNEASAHAHAADPNISACNSQNDVALHQQPGQGCRAKPGSRTATFKEQKSALPLLSGDQKGGSEGGDLSNGLHTRGRRMHGASIEHKAHSNGNSQGREHPGHERHSPTVLAPTAEDGNLEEFPGDESIRLEQGDHGASLQRAERDVQEEAAEPLPVSVGPARVSSDTVGVAKPSCLPASTSSKRQPPGCEEGTVDSLSHAGEPAWITGFRSDIGRAVKTPFLHPDAQSSPAERGTPAVSLAAGAADTHFKHSRQNGGAESSEEDLSRTSTPRRPSGHARQGAAPGPLRSSQSRGALMQGWRSIMQGSPEHSSSKSLLAAAAQKGGLDLAWRLNEVVHELSSCLARTAEQQQLLNDAARLLTHGEEEDTDYAAEKLQAADELRQWSEAAQCSSIACLVGILKELQHSRQVRAEEVHLDTAAWLAVLRDGGPVSGGRFSRR